MSRKPMNFLLSAKGKDITAWRAAEDFTAGYRQVILNRATSGRNGTAETLYSGTLATLDKVAKTHRTLLGQLDSILEEGAAAPPAYGLRELTSGYYDVLYRHMDAFHSAPAFYRKSMDFVKMLSNVILTRSKEQFVPYAHHLPKMGLIALGTAGRCEYSPFCHLQLLLVHEDVTGSQLQPIDLFCQTLHDEFEAAGLPLDPVISPRNPEWRGSIATWRQRCDDGPGPATPESLVNFMLLTDQCSLTPAEGMAQELKELAIAGLRKNRPAQAKLIVKMESLSNGLGIMGGFKLERGGTGRGLFSLRNHGLLTLSAAVSALALIKESSAVSSCDRILDLLKRRELDVELAEKILETWHNLHELLLRREQAFSLVDHTEKSLFLNPDELTNEQRHSLKTALTSVAAIQRHVGVVFSGMGE